MDLKKIIASVEDTLARQSDAYIKEDLALLAQLRTALALEEISQELRSINTQMELMRGAVNRL